MDASLQRVLSNAGYVVYTRRAGLPNRSERRAIFLSASVSKMIDPSHPTVPAKPLAGILMRLNRFVEGARLHVSTPLIGDGHGDLKGLRGFEKRVFQIRFWDVAPQYRMLGAFPMKDFFVGTHLYLRDDLKDGRFNDACAEVIASIRRMGVNAPVCLTHHDMGMVLTDWRVSQ